MRNRAHLILCHLHDISCFVSGMLVLIRYEAMGRSALSEPLLRAQQELDCKAISEASKTKDEVVAAQRAAMKEIFGMVSAQPNTRLWSFRCSPKFRSFGIESMLAFDHTAWLHGMCCSDPLECLGTGPEPHAS